MAAENREKAEPSRGKSPSSPVRRTRTAFSLHIERNAYRQRLRHWNSGCTRLCDSYLIFTFPFTQTLDWLIKRNDYLFLFSQSKKAPFKTNYLPRKLLTFLLDSPHPGVGSVLPENQLQKQLISKEPLVSCLRFQQQKGQTCRRNRPPLTQSQICASYTGT